MRATIHLAPSHLLGMMYTPGGGAVLMHAYRAGEFQKVEGLLVTGEKFVTGEDVAEEMFDLSNNPSRQDERELRYGRYRSVSVGDIIEVEDKLDPEKTTTWRCESMGWKQIGF